MLILNILCLLSSTVAVQFDLLPRNNSFNWGITKTFLKQDEAADYAQEAYYLNEFKWYQGGRRQKGDSLKYSFYDGNYYNQPKDLYVQLQFPEQEQFYITLVEAYVQQESIYGRAYITEGGIGYSYMTLLLEARDTKYWNYHIYIYGRNYT